MFKKGTPYVLEIYTKIFRTERICILRFSSKSSGLLGAGKMGWECGGN